MIVLNRIVWVLAFWLYCTFAWTDSGPGDFFTIPSGCEAKQPANTTWGRVDLWDSGEVVQVNAARFEQIFDQPWPATETVTRQIVIRRSEYAALKLIASPGFGDSGLLTFDSGALGDAPRMVAISECPGQFEGLAAACSKSFDAGFLSWSNGGDSSVDCALVPGNIYYFNIINAAPPNLAIPQCPLAACATRVQIQGPGGRITQPVPASSDWSRWGLVLLFCLLAIRYYRT